MIRDGNSSLTYARFLELFYDKNFSFSVRDHKTTEFQTLTQGNRIVAEYDCIFTELSRYAPHTVNTEYRKARKFESGLREPIQDRVHMLNMPTYIEALDKAILAKANLNKYQSSGKNHRKIQNYDNRRAPFNAKKKVNVGSSSNSNQENGTRPTCTSCEKQHWGVCHRASRVCFECGEMGHRVKDYPKTKIKDGHEINEEGISVNPSIVSWTRPTNVSEVRSFLDLAGYYKKFVKDFSKIAMPLTQLTQKGVAYEWTEDRESSFQELKTR
ncbi:uncharacterized protein LOC114318849 [Camellia sinensis]|uniref:uncharacterized protein LOC114318849 n=1 Tax=Camellia sinensis TaxID=4442 RepID=UPI001036304D|nr:uncharacterized protein LOC114318849 [Camellia sinensis]